MEDKSEELDAKLREVQQLLDSMAMELRFRGCDDNHRLVRQARELSKWFNQYKKLNEG